MPIDQSLRALDAHFQAMPPVAAMQVRIVDYDGDCLQLHAPLSHHVNDKGCAFGGSLNSLLTLASWGLVTLRVEQAGLDAGVFVADSQVRFLAPLFSDIEAQSRIADDASWETFISTLRTRGRARISLVSHVPLPDGGTATECRARYVAIRRSPG